jgi:hypothetical protein
MLDNFSTLGEVEDENAASSFNAIQQFLLQLKVQGVATTRSQLMNGPPSVLRQAVRHSIRPLLISFGCGESWRAQKAAMKCRRGLMA